MFVAVRVVVTANTDGNSFEGFFVQARTAAGGDDALGTFSFMDTQYIQTLDCGSTDVSGM